MSGMGIGYFNDLFGALKFLFRINAKDQGEHIVITNDFEWWIGYVR